MINPTDLNIIITSIDNFFIIINIIIGVLLAVYILKINRNYWLNRFLFLSFITLSFGLFFLVLSFGIIIYQDGGIINPIPQISLISLILVIISTFFLMMAGQVLLKGEKKIFRFKIYGPTLIGVIIVIIINIYYTIIFNIYPFSSEWKESVFGLLTLIIVHSI
ncbi:MAG: hypothetical protein GF329_19615, partial [Candidatus Lokiarchaeota archaeon]|nr:hypothetical protein [Candidatus Lokiarchaeota archaeon]